MIGQDKNGRYKCAKCKDWKYPKEFPENKKKRNGLDSYCYVCRKVYSKKWAHDNGIVKGIGKGKYKHKLKPKPILTIEERRLKRIEYGYIPKGSFTGYCKKCKILKSCQVINDIGMCAICHRKRSNNKKLGRPRKYSGSKRLRRIKSIQTDKARASHIATKHRRRLRERQQGSFTGKELLALYRKYNHTCLKCKCKNCQLTPDHVIPLSKGGSNAIDNIQPLCFRCNTLKGADNTDYR